MSRIKKRRVREQRNARNVQFFVDDLMDPTEEDIKLFDPDLVYDLMTEPLRAASSYRSNIAARALLRMIKSNIRDFTIRSYIEMDKTYYRLCMQSR